MIFFGPEEPCVCSREEILGPNRLLHQRQISVKIKTKVLHLSGASMEHFLEGSALLRLWKVYLEEKIYVWYSSHLG